MSLLVGLTVLSGALPAVFAFLVAHLVTGLPAAVHGGFGTAAGHHLIRTLAEMAAVLVIQEAVTSGRLIVQSDLYRRYEEYLLARVRAATLSAPRLELFEDPAFAGRLDRTAMLARLEPGDLVDGLATKWAAQAQGAAATVLVGTVWPVAALVLATVWLLANRQLQTNYQRLDLEYIAPTHRAEYLRSLAIGRVWAKELRIFGLVDWISSRFGDQRQQVLTQLAAGRRVGQRTTTVLLAAVVIVNALVIIAAARAAIGGSLGTGALLVLVQGTFGMALLAAQDGDNLIGYGASRVPHVIDIERSVTALPSAPPGTLAASGLPASDITLKGVLFRYPGRDAPVYDGLDLRIEAGHSLAVVGLNGAGKTTLAKLIAGLELPQQGTITIDGVDLAALELESWRRGIAAIFQDFVRYDLPARDNVGFGAVEALHSADAEEHMRIAATRAGAGDILSSLPAGLTTPLSPRFAGGVDLSGGQWQRIAIARAMMAVQAGARMLILDEPTAHLDVRAESDLYDRFLRITRGLTTIVISHRFSTVRRADRIVVLNAGRVTEDGTHAELLAVGGEYARLFGKQAMRYTDSGSHDA